MVKFEVIPTSPKTRKLTEISLFRIEMSSVLRIVKVISTSSN